MSTSASTCVAMRLPAPGTALQASGDCPGVTWSPSCTSTTWARTPSSLSSLDATFVALTSSTNLRSLMPSAVTMFGVVLVTMPMKPIGTPFIHLTLTGGSAGTPQSASSFLTWPVWPSPASASVFSCRFLNRTLAPT
jgi:hypothetical protein